MCILLIPTANTLLERIKHQVTPASLTSATTGRTINLKTVQKELDLFDATGERTPRMLKIMRAIETIPPTSVEAERSFSAAGLFITKLRTRLNNRSVDALCFLMRRIEIVTDRLFWFEPTLNGTGPNTNRNRS